MSFWRIVLDWFKGTRKLGLIQEYSGYRGCQLDFASNSENKEALKHAMFVILWLSMTGACTVALGKVSRRTDNPDLLAVCGYIIVGIELGCGKWFASGKSHFCDSKEIPCRVIK